jgi:hypothetical protein
VLALFRAGIACISLVLALLRTYLALL